MWGKFRLGQTPSQIFPSIEIKARLGVGDCHVARCAFIVPEQYNSHLVDTEHKHSYVIPILYLGTAALLVGIDAARGQVNPNFRISIDAPISGMR